MEAIHAGIFSIVPPVLAIILAHRSPQGERG